MKYFIPGDVVITDSSIPEGTDQSGTAIPAWSITSGYIIGAKVSHNKRIAQAFTNIPALATYSWNDPSASVTPICTRLADGVSVTATAVPCAANTTIVYILASQKDTTNVVVGRYFKFIGVTGNIDFTAINPTSHASWEEVIGYRYLSAEPETGNTIYWEDLGASNRNRCTDKAYNSQSIGLSTVSEWWEFKLRNAEEVVLFNIAAHSARIVAYTTVIGDAFYDNMITPLIDTTSIVNWRTLSQYVPLFTKGARWTLPFYAGEITVRVYLTNPSAGTVALGEILPGRKAYVGATLSKVPIQVKSKSTITELPNGDIIFPEEGDTTKVYTLFDFVVKFESANLDVLIDRVSEMINRRIVIFAENTDAVNIRSFNIYGFIQDASPDYSESDTQSSVKIQVRRLK